MGKGDSNYKHGLSRTPEYRAWQTMRLRCLEPSNPAYPAYGGRGITVCDRWKDSPDAFVEDMGQKPSPEYELDRIDNDGPYAPENCRWVPRTVNSRNRRSNVWISLGGESRTLAEWCERLDMPRDTIRKRLAAGWPPEEVFSVPVRRKAPKGERSDQHQCADCGKPGVYGQRCKSCENKARWQRGTY